MDHAFANYDAEQGDLADASSSGDLDRLLELLEGADVNGRDIEPPYVHPLHAASRTGHLACVQALLAANADVHASDEVKRSGTTALVVASRTGHHTCVLSLLAAGAEVDKAEVFGTTSLTAATKNGHLACVQVLLEAGANVHASRGDDAPTPIGLVRALLLAGRQMLAPSWWCWQTRSPGMRARTSSSRRERASAQSGCCWPATCSRAVAMAAPRCLTCGWHACTVQGHYLNVAKGAPAVPACDTSPDRSIPGPRKRERERATAERRMRCKHGVRAGRPFEASFFSASLPLRTRRVKRREPAQSVACR